MKTAASLQPEAKPGETRLTPYPLFSARFTGQLPWLLAGFAGFYESNLLPGAINRGKKKSN